MDLDIIPFLLLRKLRLKMLKEFLKKKKKKSRGNWGRADVGFESESD